MFERKKRGTMRNGETSEQNIEFVSSGRTAFLPRWGTDILGVHWYFAFFLASGFCSLVYEVVWLRLAMAEFGVTTPMVSIVLSMFMAGLALGSWGGGRLAARLQAPPSRLVQLYAAVELAIAASADVVPAILARGGRVL